MTTTAFLGLLIVLFVSVQSSAPTKPPLINYVSQKQKAEPGDTVVLVCSVNNLDGRVLSWTKISEAGFEIETPISMDETILINDPRFTVLQSSNNPTTYTLTIDNFQGRDAGSYRCQVHSSNSHSLSRDSEVESNGADTDHINRIYGWEFPYENPAITYVKPDQVIDRGGRAVFDCSVKHDEDFAVLWSKIEDDDDSLIRLSTEDTLLISNPRFSVKHDQTTSTYTLEIDDLRASDSGTYRCEIQISATDSIFKDVKLRVENRYGDRQKDLYYQNQHQGQQYYNRRFPNKRY